MIVVAIARSGATKICMDLAEEHGIKFLGEMTPRNMSQRLRYRKDINHETKFEMRMTEEEYCKAIERDPQYISLVNNAGADLLTADADYVVMRKDLKANLYSWLNYIIKTVHGGKLAIGNEEVIHRIKYITLLDMILDTAYGIITYCLNNDKKIIWYEDYFPGMDTKYDLIPENWHKKIDQTCDKYDFVFSAHDRLVKKYCV